MLNMEMEYTRKKDHVDLDNDREIKKEEHSFKDSFKSYMTRASIEGIALVLDPDVHVFRKVVWVFFILFGLGFVAYQIQNRVSYLMTFPTSVDIREVYSLDGIRFPVVTICNENVWRLSAIQNHGSYAVSLATEIYSPLSLFDIETNRKPNLTGVDFAATNWEQFYVSVSHQKEDMILLCNYANEKCTPANFSAVPTDMGLCYSFNKDQALVSERAGERFGLQLLIDIESAEYVALQTNSINAGIRIYLHDKHEIPRMTRKGLRIGPGNHVSVQMKLTKKKNQPIPWGPCDPTRKLSRFVNQSYTVTACTAECEAKYIALHCGCRLTYIEGPERICNPKDLVICVNNKLEEYVRQVQTSTTSLCECPVACADIVYEPKVSSAGISDFWANRAGSYFNSTLLNTMKNIIKLDIYFTDMSYTTMDENVAYDTIALLCDIGGALGLLLGSTLYTFFGIVDFLAAVSLSRKGDSARKIEVKP